MRKRLRGIGGLFSAAAAIVMAAVAGLIVASLWLFNGVIQHESRDKVVAPVELVVSMVENYKARAAKGEFSEDEAKRRAASAISAMRYDGTNYVFIFDRDGMTVAHARADLVGKSLLGLKDIHGREFIRDLRDLAMREGSGYTTYL